MRTSKKVFWATAATLALGLTLTAATQAQPGRRGRAGGTPDRPAMHQRMMDRLDLSDAQKEQLLEMRLKHRQEALRRRGKIADLQAQLRAEFLGEPVNESKVKSLARELADLRSQAMKARVDQRLAMMNVLTPDQRKELRKMGAMRARGMGEMRGRRMGAMHGRGMPGRFGPGMGSMHHGCCKGRGGPRDRGMMEREGCGKKMGPRGGGMMGRGGCGERMGPRAGGMMFPDWPEFFGDMGMDMPAPGDMDLPAPGENETN